MMNNRYKPPIIIQLNGGGPGSETGDGSNQGSITPEGMTYEEWWEDIAWEGENPDCDYNGDGEINQADYDYWLENELWKG